MNRGLEKRLKALERSGGPGGFSGRLIVIQRRHGEESETAKRRYWSEHGGKPPPDALSLYVFLAPESNANEQTT